MSAPATAPVATFGNVALGKMVTQKSNLKEGREAHYLRAAHIQPFGQVDLSISKKTMWFSDHEIERLNLERGDVVIVEGGAGYGRSAVIPDSFEGWGFQNSIVRVRPDTSNACGRYLSYALQMSLDQGFIELEASTATIPHFTAEKVSRFRVPVHPAATQRAIADYLDRETAEIDAMSAELDELVARLEGRRSTAIDIVMKKAELAHGNIAIGFNFSVLNGDRGASYPSAKEIVEVGIPFINAGDLHSDTVSLDTCKRVSDVKYREMGGAKLRIGDVLFCLRGSLGKSALVNFDEGALASSLCAVRARSSGKMTPSFILAAMKSTSFGNQIRFAETGSAQPNLGADQLSGFKVPAPPLDEQRRIVEHLDEVTAELDSMIANARELKTLLAERRSALITEVVTGRKGVPF